VHDVRPGELLRLGPTAGRGLVRDGPPRRGLLLIARGTGLAPLRALDQPGLDSGWRAPRPCVSYIAAILSATWSTCG
jgi:NAD(P)H-flavin reductase